MMFRGGIRVKSQFSTIRLVAGYKEHLTDILPSGESHFDYVVASAYGNYQSAAASGPRYSRAQGTQPATRRCIAKLC